jgi:hypothetical protein
MTERKVSRIQQILKMLSLLRKTKKNIYFIIDNIIYELRQEDRQIRRWIASNYSSKV